VQFIGRDDWLAMLRAARTQTTSTTEFLPNARYRAYI
jgi:hypothetical protein